MTGGFCLLEVVKILLVRRPSVPELAVYALAFVFAAYSHPVSFCYRSWFALPWRFGFFKALKDEASGPDPGVLAGDGGVIFLAFFTPVEVWQCPRRGRGVADEYGDELA